MTDKRESQKSLLQIQLENEAKNKKTVDDEQIKELNRAMIQGLDLNKAAKSIFGPGPDNKNANKKDNGKIKSKDTLKFNQKWNE